MADAGLTARLDRNLFQQLGLEYHRGAPAGWLLNAGFTLDFHGAAVGLAA
jgi:hypothetical protein